MKTEADSMLCKSVNKKHAFTDINIFRSRYQTYFSMLCLMNTDMHAPSAWHTASRFNGWCADGPVILKQRPKRLAQLNVAEGVS